MATRYHHLTVEERNIIHRGRVEGLSLRAIGRQLGRSPSTLAREVTRNGSSGGYDAIAAERGYRRRRAHRRRKLAPGTPLWEPVVMDLYRGWSPEQIAGRRRVMYPDDPAQRVSHETIYLALYALPRGALRKALLAQLRQGHTTRRSRRRGQDRRGGLKNMTSIHDRPTEALTRAVPGHWEGDLIKGAGNRSAVGTLVERTSRFIVLARMAGTDAEAALAGFTRALRPLRPELRKTLTYDQGKEMARHEELAQRLELRVYFADPHSPWQRPSNENANGLIREYLPKGLELSTISQAQLNALAERLNGRPRKVLGFQTPAEVFH